jgi:polysaccharide export outer membrane protein
MKFLLFSKWLTAILLLAAVPGFAQDAESDRYAVQPGDTLEVSVWREVDLLREVLVRPDGLFSFPLVGDIDANNKTVDELTTEVARRLQRFISDPVVTITVKGIDGSRSHSYSQGNRW